MIMKNEPFVGVRASAESGVRPTSHEHVRERDVRKLYRLRYVRRASRTVHLYIHNMLHATENS